MLSKQYRLGTIGAGTIREDVQRWWHRIRGKEDPYLKIGDTNDRRSKGSSDYVWALKDINFEVMPGDILGIIGKNGAGKSTLLKILSKVTGPTTGRIDFNGRIGSLLEVGTGFHPDLTGRENIFLNGAILGMTKREIRSKLEEIIDFSGCERYIDTPVKRYSSGMTVRLGFAIAAHLDPEILVVDEVLAVGDAEFQKKAIGKMQDVSKNEGRSVLFVSHNMGSIRHLCNKGVLLSNGCVETVGAIDTLINQYLEVQANTANITHVNISSLNRRFETSRQLEFIEVYRKNAYQIAMDEPLQVSLLIKRNNQVKRARLIGMLNYEDETRVGLFFSKEFEVPNDQEYFLLNVVLENHNLAYGRYFFDFNIGRGDYTTTSMEDYDVVYNTVSFKVEYSDRVSRSYITSWKNHWGRNCFQDVEVNLAQV
ncbi:hypothetical protein GCM10027347_53890 [Larkinella harenae]